MHRVHVTEIQECGLLDTDSLFGDWLKPAVANAHIYCDISNLLVGEEGFSLEFPCERVWFCQSPRFRTVVRLLVFLDQSLQRGRIKAISACITESTYKKKHRC